MAVQCRSLYLVDNGKEATYFRCLLDDRHTSNHYGAAIDQFGTLIPEHGEEVSWPEGHSLNVSFDPYPNHPHHPDQMQFNTETPQ